MSHPAVVLGLCLVLAGCATATKSTNLVPFDPQLIVQEPVARVPLINAGNLQWRVRAEVNGQDGVFALDTGSDTTILTPQFAKKIGALGETVAVRHAGHNRVARHVNFADLTYLQLGGIIYLNFYAPIVNLDHINSALRAPIDGILGNNVLRKTACSIDWRNNLLTLDTQFVPRPANAMPVTVRDNRIYFLAQVNGQDTEFALDTGAYCSSLTEDEIRRLNIPKSKASQVNRPQIDIAESHWAMQTQIMLDSFRLGAIERTNVPVLAWKNTVLGMDLLDSWILSFDARAGWMALTPY